MKNINSQKRVLAIHDISCIGKCSLTVALPIISSFGIETAVIPTAVLSTHTGGFNDYTYRDLTTDINTIANHHKSLGIHYDAIYTGFLGSIEQVDIVKDVINALKTEDCSVIVDPAMADNGKLYTSFTYDFPDKMRELCEMADIIIPNTTEAKLLLGERWTDEKITTQLAEAILKELCKLGKNGPKRAVLTGVYEETTEGKELYGAAGFDGLTQTFDVYGEEKIGDLYHGSGDVWASVFVGALVSGEDLSTAMWRAVHFTKEAISLTYRHNRDERFGLEFEGILHTLARP